MEDSATPTSPVPQEIDLTKAYTEACTTMRHYSNVSFTVRAGSVIQGLTIFLAWVTVLTPTSPGITARTYPRPLIAFALPIGGLLFTGLLYRFHVGYFKASALFYEAVRKMELLLFPSGFRPIGDYHTEHENKLYRSRWSKIATLHAPFTLVGILFVIALLADAVVFYMIKNPC